MLPHTKEREVCRWKWRKKWGRSSEVRRDQGKGPLRNAREGGWWKRKGRKRRRVVSSPLAGSCTGMRASTGLRAVRGGGRRTAGAPIPQSGCFLLLWRWRRRIRFLPPFLSTTPSFPFSVRCPRGNVGGGGGRSSRKRTGGKGLLCRTGFRT